jgi:hypothetical protein
MDKFKDLYELVYLKVKTTLLDLVEAYIFYVFIAREWMNLKIYKNWCI